MSCDPRSDPQPGDDLRGDGQSRRIVKREGNKVLIDTWGKRYWLRLDRWEAWCKMSKAEAAGAGAEPPRP